MKTRAKILELAAELGHDTEAIADRVGCTRSYVARVMTALGIGTARTRSTDRRRAAAEALGISMATLRVRIHRWGEHEAIHGTFRKITKFTKKEGANGKSLPAD